VSESSSSAFKISSDSDSLDLTSTFEDASEALFGGSVAQVTDEDAVGVNVTFDSGSSFSLSISSLFSGSSGFNNEGSASEFGIVLQESLLETVVVVKSDKGNTLRSSTSSLQEVDVFNSAAVREVLGDLFSGAGERKTLNESFELGSFSSGRGVCLLFFLVGHFLSGTGPSK
jgi:hypothetical protein